MACSEEYFLLLMDILPSWEMWKDLFHILLHQKWSQVLLWFVGTGLFVARADWSLLIPKNTLLLKSMETECHWYDYLSRYWKLHLSRFPRMQLGTNLQEQQFTFPNYKSPEVAQWKEFSCYKTRELHVKTPLRNSKEELLLFSLNFHLSRSRECSAGCKGSMYHLICLNTKSKTL